MTLRPTKFGRNKVKELMDNLISGRKAWWKSRQSLSLKGPAPAAGDVSKAVAYTGLRISLNDPITRSQTWGNIGNRATK